MGSFDESKHPRDHGKFAVSEGDGSSKEPKAGATKKKFELTGTTNDVDHSLERAKYHAARAKMHAEKAAAATNDLDRKKWALAAAVSQKHAERHAKLAEKYAKKDGSALAKQKAEEARSHANRAKEHATQAASIADHGATSAATPGNGTQAPAKSTVSIHADASGKVTEAAVHEAAHRDLTPSEYEAFKTAASLSKTEQRSVGMYTGEHYVGINGRPGTGVKGLRNPPPDKMYEAHIANIDTAIAKSAAPIDMLVHRGVDGRVHMQNLKVGSTFGDNGYSSTSAVEGASFQHKEVMMHISVPKGHHALSVENHSEVENEKEILLPRGSQFRVTKVTEGKTFTYGSKKGTKQLVIHCEVV